MKIVNISPTISLHIYLHEKALSFDENMNMYDEERESIESAIYNCDGFYKDAAKLLLDSFQEKYCDKFIIELIKVLQEDLEQSQRERIELYKFLEEKEK